MFNPKLNNALLLADYALQDLDEKDYTELKDNLEELKMVLLSMIED